MRRATGGGSGAARGRGACAVGAGGRRVEAGHAHSNATGEGVRDGREVWERGEGVMESMSRGSRSIGLGRTSGRRWG